MTKTMKEQLEEEKAELAKLTNGAEVTLPAEFNPVDEEDELVEVEDGLPEPDDAEPEEQPEPEKNPVNNPIELPPLQPITPQQDNQMGYELRQVRKELAELKAKKEEPVKEIKQVPPRPDPNEDPIGYTNWRADRLEEQAAEDRAWRQQQEAKEQAKNAAEEKAQYDRMVLQGATQEYARYHQQYAASSPDFNNAYQFMGNKIYQKLAILNPRASGDELQELTTRQLLEEAGTAFNRGINPAQYIDYLARNTYGYQTQAVKPAEKPLPNLAKLAKNQRKSVSGIGGSGGKTITFRDMDNMSPAEMQEIKRTDPEEYRRLTRFGS